MNAGLSDGARSSPFEGEEVLSRAASPNIWQASVWVQRMAILTGQQWDNPEDDTLYVFVLVSKIE